MMTDWDVLARDPVPSSQWSAGTAHLGPSTVEPLLLGGSPIVDLPAEFLAGIDVDSVGRRMPARGLPELRAALAEHYGRHWGRAIDPGAEVVITNGAMHALDSIIRALVAPGGTVGMLCPGFFLDRLVADRPARLVRFDTSSEDDWQPTPALLRRIEEEPVDLLVVINPGNPTGAVLEATMIERLVEATQAAGTPILVDEAYEAFVYDDRRHVAFASLDRAWPRTVTVHSFTKGFGLRASRVGSVIGPPALIDRIAGVVEWSSLAVNPVSQLLAVASLRHVESWQPRLVATFTGARSALSAAVDDGLLPVSTLLPQGGTFAALDVRGWPDASTAAREVWQATGLACAPWSVFPGDPAVTDGWLRLGLGAADGVFATALERLAAFAATTGRMWTVDDQRARRPG
jgi:N-succinyldiaminopimelate aminotransferase